MNSLPFISQSAQSASSSSTPLIQLHVHARQQPHAGALKVAWSERARAQTGTDQSTCTRSPAQAVGGKGGELMKGR